VQLDPFELSGATVTLEVAGKVYEATVSDKDDEGCSGPNNASYHLTYKRKSGSRGRAKASGWIDFDLPVGEKCSWWRLDGYETYSEDEDEDGNPEAPSADEMVEDSEEEAIRSDNSDLDCRIQT
jgi:hypothetical protein